MGKAKKFAGAPNKPLSDTATAKEADHFVFGENIGAPDEGRQVTWPKDIHHIYPDRSQPRRAIPSEVRAGWNGQPGTVYQQAILRWVELVSKERGAPFDLAAYLQDEPVMAEATDETLSENEPEADETAPGPLETSLLKVLELAVSIRRDGLTNPITVVPDDTDYYRLETGERRWLAYHILHHHSGDPDKWARIPAREVDEFNVWRQASENNARDSLNAISRARQIAILLMDLWAQNGKNFEPFEQMASEYSYYLQAADLGTPYGKGPQLLNALGFQNMSTLARHKILLKLSPEAWLLADDYNCPEGVLREIVKLEDEHQVMAILNWQKRIFASGKDSGEKPFESKTFSVPSPEKNGHEPAWKARLNSMFTPQKWHKMPVDERRQAYDHLRSLLLQLEEMGLD